LLTQITGINVQPNKAIVGANAFAHESGIHQDGLIKEKSTYEIMTPQSVGISATHIVLGKHSGRHAIADRLKAMGYGLTEEEINRIFVHFKELADMKKEVFDEDLEAIVYEEASRAEERYRFLYLNVVSGNPVEIGNEMCANPAVRKLSFTGSTAVGRLLMQQVAPTVKKLSLELGGNAPFIVFDDADLDAAVEGAMISKFRNAGQTCVCANRIFVQDKVYAAFAEKLAVKVAALKVGVGTESGVTQGPLINARALAKVEAHVADAVGRGAKVALGGKRHGLGGNFYEPTILTDVTPAMQIFSEETFGPVAPLIRFKDDAEVVRMANDSEFGLASYFYSRDIGRAWRIAEQLEAGMVGVNTGLVTTHVAPFGGVKQSGLGREGSKYGIDEFVEVKYICFGGIDR